jgi:hypothetical protein
MACTSACGVLCLVLLGHAAVSVATQDNPGDLQALKALASSTNIAKWKKSKHWNDSSRSVCDWYGIGCNAAGRVISVVLKSNGLDGALPAEMKLLTELETLHLQGSRPANYQGCSTMNFKNSSMSPLYNLQKLKDLDFEYSCIAGTLDGVNGMKAMQSFQVHGNYISGTIPKEIGELTDLVTLKMGRNPITGTLPAITTLKKVVQFNCNFCALHGEFPDIFGELPSLEITYWDGNGFSGSLPPSIGLAKKLTRLSFNINNFTGPIPESICNIPAGKKGGDCRIGADTELGPYQAFYPWMLPVRGDYYDCSAGVPSCVLSGNSCNTTDMYPSKAQNYSIVRCSNKGAVTMV